MVELILSLCLSATPPQVPIPPQAPKVRAEFKGGIVPGSVADDGWHYYTHADGSLRAWRWVRREIQTQYQPVQRFHSLVPMMGGGMYCGPSG